MPELSLTSLVIDAPATGALVETVALPSSNEGVMPSKSVCTFVKPARYASGPRKVPGLVWQVKKTMADL